MISLLHEHAWKVPKLRFSEICRQRTKHPVLWCYFSGWNYVFYRKLESKSTCYYSGNQVFGGATNRDMSLNETCYYSKIQKFWTLKSQLVTCPKGYLFAWILIKILLCLDFKSFFAWISYASLLGLVVNLKLVNFRLVNLRLVNLW